MMSGFGGFGQQPFFGSGSSSSGGDFGHQPHNSFSSNLFSSTGGSGHSLFPTFGSSSSASNGNFGTKPFPIEPNSFASRDFQSPNKNWHFDDFHKNFQDLDRSRYESYLRPTIGGRWDSENGFRGQSGLNYKGFNLSRSYAPTGGNFLKGLVLFVLGAGGLTLVKKYKDSVERSSSIQEGRRDAGWPDGTHVAVVGAAGTGKSSLVNALRGMRNGRPGATPVGTTETTREVQRYLRRGCESFWIHDVPGAGTASVQEEGYFGAYRLYLYDCILVVYSDRLRKIDIAVLKACDELSLPVCLIRSKSDQIIRNIVDDPVDDQEMTAAEAKEHHIKTTLDDVRGAFDEAKLPDRLMSSVFIVNKNGLYSFVTGGNVHEYDIHERRLVDKLDAFSS